MNIISSIAKYAKQFIVLCKPLYDKCLSNPALILRIDGGTCSQLCNNLSIKIAEETYPARILVDLSWYSDKKFQKNDPLARPYNFTDLCCL